MDDEAGDHEARTMIGLALGLGLAAIGVAALVLCYYGFVALGQALGSL